MKDSLTEADCCAWIRDEVKRISNSPAFARAPVMRRLLNFLAEETVAGRGNELKAYSVAVDGLGRSAEFDPQADSYPRVQVGRLRRMIDQFYRLEPGETRRQRLHIPVGSYRVHCLPAETGKEEETATPPPAVAPPPRRRRTLLILTVLFLLLLGGGLFAWTALRTPAVPQAPGFVEAPLLETEPVKLAENADPLVARRVERILGHALHRSWTVRLAEKGRRGDYRLAPILVGREPRYLYLTLSDERTHTQIWSTRIVLPETGAEITARLAPSLAAIMAPRGVIASNERQRLRNSRAPGYPCMLHYARYFVMSTVRDERAIRACLDRTLQLEPDYAPAIAAAIHMRYRTLLARPEDAPAVAQKNLRIAQQAVETSPFSPDAQIALATAAVVVGRCELANASKARALELNPYDAGNTVRAGLLDFACGGRAYEAQLRHAWELDPALPPMSAIPLLIAAAERGEGSEALTRARSLPSGEALGRPAYELTMVVALAAAGQREEARAAWRALAQKLTSDAGAEPARVLPRIIFIPPLAARVEAFLRRAAVLSPAAGR